MTHASAHILVVRFSSIGDILLTTPALRALRRCRPEARIHYVVKAGYADLLRANPNVDRVVAWDPSTGIAGLLGAVGEGVPRYDLVIDLHRSLRSFALRHLLRASRRLRYPKGVFSRFLMIRTGWKAIAMKAPVPERYLRAIAPLGTRGDGRGIDFPITDAARERAAARLATAAREAGLDEATGPGGPAHEGAQGPAKAPGGDESRPWLAVSPGARWSTKRWLPERFARAADALSERLGLASVLLGGPDDRPVTETVRRTMKGPVIDLAGRLDLPETGAVLERSRLLLCNDSGLMHMATAFDTPVIAIFGPTTRELGFYPYRASSRVMGAEIKCRPCHPIGGERCPRGHHRCMTEVSAEEVVEAAVALVRAAGGSSDRSGSPRSGNGPGVAGEASGSRHPGVEDAAAGEEAGPGTAGGGVR